MRHACSTCLTRQWTRFALVSRSAIALLAVLAILSVLIVFVSPMAPTQLTVIRAGQSAPMGTGFAPATVVSTTVVMVLQTLSLLAMRRYAQARGRGPTVVELTCSRVC